MPAAVTPVAVPIAAGAANGEAIAGFEGSDHARSRLDALLRLMVTPGAAAPPQRFGEPLALILI